MKGLSQALATAKGEDNILKRLHMIDTARGILNSIVIDTDGEGYDFKNVTLSGVKDILDATCNMISAVSDIPQTRLFGMSPGGLNSTGQSDLENLYNSVEIIQKLQLEPNFNTLIDFVIRGKLHERKLEEPPTIKFEFSPLWSLSETEQADVDQKKAQTAYTKAQTAQIYVDMGALDPTEVREGLKEEGEFKVEELLDNIGADEELPMWGGAQGELRDDADDPEWVTVNGAHIPITESGGLGGKAGERIKSESQSSAKLSPIDAVLGKEFVGVKGRAAVDKLLDEKEGHVKGAFTRGDIGDIDLIWGNDNIGVQHIIKRRKEEGQDWESVLRELPEVVEKGKLAKKVIGGKHRFVITHNGHEAIVDSRLYGSNIQFVLTAYEQY
jgi:hypothetical protein